MIPIRDENPTRRFPVLTVVLIVINIAVFAYEVSLPDQALLDFIGQWAVNPAALVADPLSLTVFPTLLTAMFLHGGWLHLGGNMLYLWIFGNNIEDRLGPMRFLGFYLVSGVIATAAHIAVDGARDIPLLGASGAIAGVLGAYLLLFPRTKVLVLIPIFFILEIARLPAAFVIGFWFVMQLLQGVGSISPDSAASGVAWWAHIGGFAAGLLLVLPLRIAEEVRSRRRSRTKRARFTTWR